MGSSKPQSLRDLGMKQNKKAGTSYNARMSQTEQRGDAPNWTPTQCLPWNQDPFDFWQLLNSWVLSVGLGFRFKGLGFRIRV